MAHAKRQHKRDRSPGRPGPHERLLRVLPPPPQVIDDGNDNNDIKPHVLSIGRVLCESHKKSSVKMSVLVGCSIAVQVGVDAADEGERRVESNGTKHQEEEVGGTSHVTAMHLLERITRRQHSTYPKKKVACRNPDMRERYR